MFEYIFLAFVCGLFALTESGQRTPRTNQMFHICLFFFLLVVGLRYGHGDYPTYEWGYNNGFDVGGDKGYFFIQDFFHNIGFSFQAFVFIITLVSVIAFKQTFRLSVWPCFGVLMILGKIFTLYAMSGIRQYIAMAICWWAISELLLNKRKLLFLVMVLCAYTFHGSAIIILPVYFIRNLKFSYKMTFLIIIVASVVGYGWRFFFEQLFEFSDLADERFGSYYRYTVYHGGGTMNMINYVENLLFLVFALWVRKSAVQRNQYYDFFLYMFIIYCGFLIAGSDIGVVKRLRDYYAISYAVIVPYFIFLFKGSFPKRLFKVVLVAYFILLMFRSLSVYDAGIIPGSPNKMVPYKSVFVLLK